MTSFALLSKTGKEISISLLCSVSLIFFLFFIDESAYNFDWTRHAGNWIAFLLYLCGFSLGQALTWFLLLVRYKGENKLALTNIIGIPLGFLLILLFFFIVRGLYA